MKAYKIYSSMSISTLEMIMNARAKEGYEVKQFISNTHGLSVLMEKDIPETYTPQEVPIDAHN